MESFPRDELDFHASKLGRRDEAGGCYFCVLPCGVMAGAGLLSVAGVIYGVFCWFHVIVR